MVLGAFTTDNPVAPTYSAACVSDMEIRKAGDRSVAFNRAVARPTDPT